MASGIGGGLIGYPYNFASTNGLVCGGISNPPTNPMFIVPIYHSQPDLVDVHIYSCVLDPTRSCFPDSARAAVQSEAAIDFSDITHFLALLNLQSAIFVLGETHSNTDDSTGKTCEGAPSTAPLSTVSGYNASGLAGHNVYFRPWLNLLVNCYSYTNNLNVNLGNNGPYKPTLQ